MPDVTPKGIPIPLGGDPISDGDNRIRDLANWVDERPGVATLTTVERDALAGVDLWQGRTIFNTTTLTLETWNGAVWTQAGGGGYTQSFLMMGA